MLLIFGSKVHSRLRSEKGMIAHCMPVAWCEGKRTHHFSRQLATSNIRVSCTTCHRIATISSIYTHIYIVRILYTCTHTQTTLYKQQQAIWAASPSRYTFPYLRLEVGCLRLRALHAWLRGASTSCHCYQSAVSVAQGDWRPPAPLPDAPRCEQELSPWRARIETAPREYSSSCAPSCLSSRVSS